MIFQRLPAVLMFGPMKRVLLISLIVTSTAFPASAQEDTGKSLMERGAELFFEGLRKEMEPTLDKNPPKAPETQE